MRLGRKVDDGPWLVLIEQALYQFGIANVAAHKNVPRIILERNKILLIASVGQLVQVENRLIDTCKPVKYKI